MAIELYERVADNALFFRLTCERRELPQPVMMSMGRPHAGWPSRLRHAEIKNSSQDLHDKEIHKNGYCNSEAAESVKTPSASWLQNSSHSWLHRRTLAAST